MTTPNYDLTDVQLKGLNKLGDVMIPGGIAASGAKYPSFSESQCGAEANRMLPYMYAGDRDPFKALLVACAVLPKPAVKGLVALVAAHAKAPEPLAALLRMANLGMKGVVHSLYYSGLRDDSIHANQGFNPRMNVAAYEADLIDSTESE